MNMLILRTVSPIHLYIMTLFAVHLLLRGHNAPGGGFIAGLLTVAAIILQAVAFNSRHAENLLPIPAGWFLGIGLLLAAGTGLGPALTGAPFLDQTFTHVNLPFFGDVEVTTALFFDLGVYLVVVGAGKWILLTIADERRTEDEHQGEQPSGG